MNAPVAIEYFVNFPNSPIIIVVHHNVLNMVVKPMDTFVGSFIIACFLNSLGFKLLMHRYGTINFYHLIDSYSANFLDSTELVESIEGNEDFHSDY